MPISEIQDVLCAEAKAIHDEDLSPGPELYRSLNKLESAALCLSGGGIRSAAFGLGVIQALATHPRSATGAPVGRADDSLLAKFHYLSTVSGGGYIGSWLSAWVTRAGFKEVWRNLVSRPQGPDEEPNALGWLRTYSNFLTPKLGISSADTWAAVAIYARNLILNWLVLLPVLCLLLLLLKLLAFTIAWVGKFPVVNCGPVLSFDATSTYLAVVGSLCLVFALVFRNRHRPTGGSSTATQAKFLRADLKPTVVAALIFAFALAFPCSYVHLRDVVTTPTGFITLAGVFAALYAVSWLVWPRWNNLRKDTAGDLVAWIVAGFLYGALVALGIYFYCKYYGGGFWLFRTSEILLLVIAVPWMLLAQLCAEIIFVGLTSFEGGSDADREWLGRAAGWFVAAAFVWFVAMFLVFAGLELVPWLYTSFTAWLATAGGVSGVITAILGKSSLSPAKGEAKGFLPVSTNVVLLIAAPFFAAVLVILISAVLDRVLLGQSIIDVMRGPVSESAVPSWFAGAKYLLLGFVVIGLFGLVTSLCVNINRFSLHALYRNRLIRAFLGASHADQRQPNSFTDFDEKDNLRAAELWPPQDLWAKVRGKDWQPFHVLNIALNLVSSKKLAWQERKAESFTVSPLHAGSRCVGFRPSDAYGDHNGGISLGTAMTISGAAASPNMGYHSSPPLAFLLTLFNVRLGWWLGNPRNESEKIYGADGPRWAVAPLLSEMFGNTTEDGTYVYLSDGGHFENLGLYEMVRRRCRFIVVSDAGCDPQFKFDDLGNAVRKIAVDLGVSIKFHELQALKGRPADGNELGVGPPYHAIGHIDYGAAGGGVIFYVKAGYHGIESAGVRAYALAKAAFPHESTGDQFFSESQFESYRSLGFEIVDGILASALKKISGKDRSLKAVFAALEPVE